MPNILDGLQCFYEREKLANEIEQGASEDQKYNALHSSCGDVVVTVPKVSVKCKQSQAAFRVQLITQFGCPHWYTCSHPSYSRLNSSAVCHGPASAAYGIGHGCGRLLLVFVRIKDRTHGIATVWELSFFVISPYNTRHD